MERNFLRLEVQPQIRLVPAFSIQSLQKNTRTGQPPSSGAYVQRKVGKSQFRVHYDRRDLPIAMDYRTARGGSIRWLADIRKLNHQYYLPIFCEGLSEVSHPYDTLARDGCIQLIDVSGDKVLGVLDQCMEGIKKALNSRNPQAIINTCRVIQRIGTCSPIVGLAFVRYYRQFLHILRMFRGHVENLGDGIDYFQRMKKVGDVVNDTLEILDRTGGPYAYAQIKYVVPTFESSLHNS